MPWGHVRTLLAKVKSVDIAILYAQAYVENGWSRTVLEWQHATSNRHFMTFVVTESCIQCKYTHCVALPEAEKWADVKDKLKLLGR